MKSLIIISALFVMGCTKGEKALIGHQWTATDSSIDPVDSPYNFTFNGDGTCFFVTKLGTTRTGKFTANDSKIFFGDDNIGIGYSCSKKKLTINTVCFNLSHGAKGMGSGCTSVDSHFSR